MNDTASPWRRGYKLPLVVLLAIAGYFLWTEHKAHVIEFLPWLLVLGCIGMHLLMHRGHSHGSGTKQSDDRGAPYQQGEDGGRER